MKKHFSFIFSIAVMISAFACHQKTEEKNATDAGNKNDTTVFYPVNDFLKKQIRLVDSTPFYIYRITIKNGKKDSSKLSKQAFDSLASFFIKKDISNTDIKKNYKESVFDDESTDSYTFNYSTKDSTMFIQTVDVLLDRDKQNVKRVFVNTYEDFRDSSITSKMGWKTDRNFYINRIIDFPNGKEIIEQNSVVWDPRP